MGSKKRSMWGQIYLWAKVIAGFAALVAVYAGYREKNEPDPKNIEQEQQAEEHRKNESEKTDLILKKLESKGYTSIEVQNFLKDLLGEDYPDILENEESRNNLALSLKNKSLHELLKENNQLKNEIKKLHSTDIDKDFLNKIENLTSTLQFNKVIKLADKYYEDNPNLKEESKSRIFYLKALAYDKLFEFEKAINQLEKAIIFYDKGLVLYSLLGNIHLSNKHHEKAKKVFLEGLRMCKKTRNLFSSSAGVLNTGVARCYQYSGEYSLSIEYLQKSLLIYEKYVDDKWNESFALQRLAQVYLLKGGYRGDYADERNEDYYKALDLTKKADLMSKGIAEEPYLIIAIQSVYSWAYTNIGDFEKALKASDKQMAYSIKIEGKESPSKAGILSHRGHMFFKQGKYKEALSDYERSRDISIKYFGVNHLSLASVYSTIGHIHRNYNNYDLAKENYEKSLAIGLKNLRGDHPSLGSYYINLGGFFYERKKYQLAKANLEKSIKIFSNIPDLNAYFLSQKYVMLGNILLAEGERREPLKPLLEAERLWCESGKYLDSQEYAQLNYQIGICYGSTLDFENARIYLGEALKLLQIIYPNGHISINDTQARIDDIKNR